MRDGAAFGDLIFHKSVCEGEGVSAGVQPLGGARDLSRGGLQNCYAFGARDPWGGLQSCYVPGSRYFLENCLFSL